MEIYSSAVQISPPPFLLTTFTMSPSTRLCNDAKTVVNVHRRSLVFVRRYEYRFTPDRSNFEPLQLFYSHQTFSSLQSHAFSHAPSMPPKKKRQDDSPKADEMITVAPPTPSAAPGALVKEAEMLIESFKVREASRPADATSSRQAQSQMIAERHCGHGPNNPVLRDSEEAVSQLSLV